MIVGLVTPVYSFGQFVLNWIVVMNTLGMLLEER
jgi:hypothetical protein